MNLPMPMPCRLLAALRHAVTAAALCLAAIAAPAAPLTLAIADLPAFAPALLAEAEGYFAAEGLDLKVIHCINGRRCLQHLTDGEADAATVADTPIVFAAHAGARFEILGTMTSSREHRLLARADRGVRSLADLKGRRLGILTGTSGHYFADSVLALGTLDPATVTRVPLAPGEIVDRLEAGDIDAAGLYQPLAQEAIRRLGARGAVVADARYYAATMNLVGRLAPGLSDDDATRLLRALRRACALIQEQPARARAQLARQLKLDASVVDALWPDYDFRITLEQTLVTTLESESRWAAREGVVANKAMPDYLDRIRPGPLRALDRRAVTLVK
ncbi:ABC transporter substrate-binding protein [Methyloversatilis sp.]|uniref:ABC transporter substrate-binding protein n=1 Tax=Methyloversatilis sp. TaxID=2569862 RepID=UPI003F6FA1D2